MQATEPATDLDPDVWSKKRVNPLEVSKRVASVVEKPTECLHQQRTHGESNIVIESNPL